jgi:hypothetical protein
MNTRGTWEGYIFQSELGFEHGDHGWKALDEQNMIETLDGGFDYLRRPKF